jgi:hypothetical protein
VKNILMLLLLIHCTSSSAQKTVVQKATDKHTETFPKNFIGNWVGTMQWMVAGKPTQNFKMQLHIQPTDSVGQYTWQIIYGDKEQDNRPYILKPVDSAKQHWMVDELNGIILDTYIHGNCAHGAFTVQGNTIVDNYCVDGNRMLVEFLSVKLGEKKQSGNNTPDSPNVDSYRIASYQKGTLKRAN